MNWSVNLDKYMGFSGSKVSCSIITGMYKIIADYSQGRFHWKVETELYTHLYKMVIPFQITALKFVLVINLPVVSYTYWE